MGEGAFCPRFRKLVIISVSTLLSLIVVVKVTRVKMNQQHTTQTAPLGATTCEKVNEQHTLSFFSVYFLTS